MCFINSGCLSLNINFIIAYRVRHNMRSLIIMETKVTVSRERIEQVISWLFQAGNENLRSDFRNKTGFAVSASRRIVTSDGEDKSLVEAMVEDGFPGEAGERVESDEYRIEYAPPRNGFRYPSMMFYLKRAPEPAVDASGLF